MTEAEINASLLDGVGFLHLDGRNTLYGRTCFFPLPSDVTQPPNPPTHQQHKQGCHQAGQAGTGAGYPHLARRGEGPPAPGRPRAALRLPGNQHAVPLPLHGRGQHGGGDGGAAAARGGARQNGVHDAGGQGEHGYGARRGLGGHGPGGPGGRRLPPAGDGDGPLHLPADRR